MTFIAEELIEGAAVELWRDHALAPGFDVEQLLDDLGLSLVWEAIDDCEGGFVLGQLLPSERLVVLNERHLERLEERQGRLRRFTIGHEIGHWTLHTQAARLANLRLFDGERIWCRDGSSDPAERQAELLSAALLIPREPLRKALPSPPWSGWPLVYRLADAFLVNVTPMLIRLERLGWIHRDEQGIPISGPAPSHGQASLFEA